MALLLSRNSQPEPCTSALRRVFSDCCKHPPCSRENEQVNRLILFGERRRSIGAAMDGTTKLEMNYTDLPLAFHEVVRGIIVDMV